MSKILIIEDNIDLASLAKDLLVRHGYKVLVCYDGVQGREVVLKEKPDLILLDLMLPGGGGFYVLERLKLSSLTKYLPIVVMTASKDKEHRRKAEELGVDAFIEKPYENQQLLSIIKGFLDDASGSTEPSI